MRTYDIVNAGSRNRFMASGRIVSNSGRSIQLQNLPQNHLPDLSLAREIVKTGDEEQLETLFGSVPNTLSELIRTAFIPRDGCRFIVADFSAIEARVLAWLAGEDWVLEEFKGRGKIYEATASRMFHVPAESIVKGNPNYEYRQKGKQATLSCIAEGQLVLTDQGLIPIEHVTLQHRVWDGERWVEHAGVIYRGRRNVITYEGLTATPDHFVWVEGKSKPIQFGVAATSGAHLTITEHCGKTVRLGEDHQPGEAVEQELEPLLCIDEMYLLSQRTMDASWKSDAREIEGVSELFGGSEANSYVVGSAIDCRQTEVRESQRQSVSPLRCAGSKIQFYICNPGWIVDFEERTKCLQRERDGSNRQQRQLRAGKHSFCAAFCKCRQSQADSSFRMGSAILALLQECGDTHAIGWKDTRGNHRVGEACSSGEKERVAYNSGTARLYDIRNAGPNHRFTVSGHLVHNCGYGGGVGALKAMGAKMPEEEMQPLVDAWRAANPHIVALWGVMERAARRVIEKQTSVRVGKAALYWKNDKMFMRLPSGRNLCYQSPHFVTNRFGNDGIGYYAPNAAGQMAEQETFGGKLVENCIAEGTLIITDRGLVPIENIKASHLIWDGEAFVHHEGVISKGRRETICVNGIQMTPEHMILTEGGWRSCGECDGLDWKAFSLPDSITPRGISYKRRATLAGTVCLREGTRSGRRRSASEALSGEIMRMYAWETDQRFKTDSRHESPSRIWCMALHEAALRGFEPPSVSKLWRARHYSLSGMVSQLRKLLAGYGADLSEWIGFRSDQQQPRLRTPELSLDRQENQYSESTPKSCYRYAAGAYDSGRVVRKDWDWRDNNALSGGSRLADRISVRKAESTKQVYDIRNCGPRHRFAVWDEGKARVVSNCTQAVARDLLAHGMMNLEAAGYPIVFHVHDEAVMEVPIGFGSVEEACEIMARAPEWARGLPLRADGSAMPFYRKE